MQYDQLKEKIVGIAENLISRDDIEKRTLKLREVFVSHSSHPIVRIYIDKEGGVNISDIEYFHRQLEMLLDAEDLIKSRYTLEVSSPGVDKK
ncbi:MAG: ribosome maturation factor RimP [bacterium]